MSNAFEIFLTSYFHNDRAGISAKDGHHKAHQHCVSTGDGRYTGMFSLPFLLDLPRLYWRVSSYKTNLARS